MEFSTLKVLMKMKVPQIGFSLNMWVPCKNNLEVLLYLEACLNSRVVHLLGTSFWCISVVLVVWSTGYVVKTMLLS
jgi:hypothetical protein